MKIKLSKKEAESILSKASSLNKEFGDHVSDLSVEIEETPVVSVNRPADTDGYEPQSVNSEFLIYLEVYSIYRGVSTNLIASIKELRARFQSKYGTTLGLADAKYVMQADPADVYKTIQRYGTLLSFGSHPK